MQRSVNVEELGAQVSRPEVATEVYLATLMAVDINTEAERDYLRRVTMQGRDERTTPVREIMSSRPGTVGERAHVRDVLNVMKRLRVRRVPVVAADGRLVGIVSRADIVALLATEWVCGACGEPVRGEHPPKACPKCGADSERFVLHEQPPGP